MSWPGVYRALVMSAADPQGIGRVRLQVPQVSGTAVTDWVPAAQSGGGLPAVGEVVWVMYQGGDASYPAYVPPIPPPPAPPAPDPVLVQDWTAPQLAAGYTANGNSNGVPMYRVITVLGSMRVEWQGGLGITYTSGTLGNNGYILVNPLPVVPTSLRSVPAACSVTTSTSLSQKIDFANDGTMRLIGPNSGNTPPWVSLNNISYFI